MNLLQGKVAVVTGAARGIGRVVALKYAAEGADVAIVVRTLDERAESLKAEILSHHVRCEAYATNVADFEAAHATITKIAQDFGHIDILVNNAGVTKDGLLLRMSEQQWDDVISTNLKSAYNFIHAVSPIMMKQRNGAIINMSSVVGLHGNAGQCNYAASKAGLVALAQSVAKELGSRGIRANCIAPGFIATDMTDKLSEETREQIVKTIPLHRAGAPEDVANVAVFLASELASYVTGQVISVCGGMNI